MKFKYKKIGPGVLRPVIPIELRYKNRTIRYEVLVDSGADRNIFDAEIGYLLGIDIKKGTPQQVAGITGVDQTFYSHNVRMVIGGHEHQVEAGFMPNMPKFGYGVVGQKGFFNLFVVKFDYQKAQVDLRHR